MKVEALIGELLKCNPKHEVTFCNVADLNELETDFEDGKTFVTTHGIIETVNKHELGVCLSFAE